MIPDDETSALFRAHHDRIYRYLLGMVHDPAEAEDLAQDTFVRAYERRESLRDKNAVRGWLYSIATRICLDRLRRRAAPVSLDGPEGAQVMDSAPSADPSAVEVNERLETSTCVQNCLDLLPHSYRAVILLHEAHGLTAPEIAGLLGESVGTIKIRLHRARRRLQDIMQVGCAISEKRNGVPCCEQKAVEEIDAEDARRLMKK